jgi:pyrroline-5-carboxylate reductase
MGTALMKGAAEIAGGGRIGFCDTDQAKAAAAAKDLGAAVYASPVAAAAKGDYVFLAVKPQALGGLLGEIAPVLGERLATGRPPVLVSMAAGWPIGKIQSLAGKAGAAASVPTARIMPNTPALIRRGMIAMAVSPELDAAKTGELAALLGAAGMVDLVDEGYLDAVTGLSGSGPAFVYLLIEALADGGVRAGLPRDKALRYAARTVLGAAAMVEETGKHPGELKDMVASPGGTTIAGLAALERGAFRGTVMDAVEAAWKRSVELGVPGPR